MTIKIHDTTTILKAIEQGFGGFNNAPHIPIELPEDEMVTLTVKQGDTLVTFCFIPNECVDIALHRNNLQTEDINDNIKEHHALAFENDGAVVKTTRNTTGITAILTGRSHYE